ncbi:serine/threonine protein kinase [Kitasatospora sp. NPDC005856]|uniref:serine/threonine protein kinase n=1 Tax=Kitasatospora sp. NPDC005856 TaxID=3154566 RepID=UPI0033C4BA4D
MTNVLVHVPAAPGGRPLTLELTPGQSARFGRGTPEDPMEIGLTDPAVPRLAGEIRASEDHWQLSNFATSQSYLVENPEGAGEYIRVAPRRIGAPIPFEFARVVLPGREAQQQFQVFAPAHTYGVDEQPHLTGDATVAAFSLDESSTYFLVLTALCEQRLRDRPGATVPTNRQVIDRLRAHPGVGELTEHAVNAHLDYLARHKLRLRRPADSAGDGTAREGGKRDLVVSVALRFGLVREDHLALLPSRANRSATTREVTR